MAGVHNVNQRLVRMGHPEVEMVRGDGYHYFIFSGEVGGEPRHESHSVMQFRFLDTSVTEWTDIGRRFAEQVKAGTYNSGTGEL